MSVESLEDDGIGFEEEVKDAVCETGVETSRQDNEFEANHADGSSECYGRHLLPALFLELNRCENVGILGCLAEFRGSFGEENWAIGFGEREECGESGTCDHQAYPECPAPTLGGRNKPGYDRGNKRSRDSSLEMLDWTTDREIMSQFQFHNGE